MKVAFVDTETAKSMQRRSEAILPLEEDPPKKLEKGEYLTFSVRTDPTDDQSPTYSLTVGQLRGADGTRAAIKFKKKINQVLDGMGGIEADDFENRARIVTQLLIGDPLTAYNRAAASSQRARHREAEAEAGREAATEYRNNNADATQAEIRTAQREAIAALAPTPRARIDHELGLNGVIKSMTPPKPLQKVRRYLRRYCRKPADMKVRAYFTNLTRINDEEIPELPPFAGDAQKIQDDELIEIILYGIPNSWKNELEKQNYDPIEDQNLTNFLARLEQLEDIPEFQPSQKKNDSKSSGSSKKNHKKPNSNNNHSNKEGDNKGGTFCLLHGKDAGHNTDGCFKLKAEAKKLKGDSFSADGNKRPYSKNKSWSKKAQDAKNKQQKELQALTKSVKSLKKELNAVAKKRKSDDDSSEDGYLAEQLDAPLANFNYHDMDNLKIDSDDDFEADAEMDDI